jgi:hypothetical protein
VWVVRQEPERRYTLSVVYPACTRARCTPDAHGDHASALVVEEACWAYARKGMRVGLGHRAGTEGAGEAVENYVYRGPRWVVRDVAGEQQTIEPGDWLLGVIW